MAPEGIGPMPLDGIRVLDIATVIAGPGVAARLGDFGADVVKVEHPVHGDTSRNLGWKVRGVGLWWKHISRNKRPVTLDLSRPEGQGLLLRLVERADVVVESFRPGTLERWNLAPDRLQERNPGLVICRISGFGQDGPYARRPGFGTLAEAMSGYVSMTGEPHRPPVLPPVALADEVAALLGAWAVTMALYHRDVRSGTGQVIDQSLFEGLFSLTGPAASVHDKMGMVLGRHGNRIPYAAPRGAYETADGRWVALSGTSQSVARRILAAIGREELIEDPRFATNDARVANVDELDETLAAWIGEHTLEEVMARFDEHEAAAAPILDMGQISGDIQYRAREAIVRVPDAELDDVVLPAPQPRMSVTPGRHRHAGLPKGAANEEIYGGELGLAEEDLTRLREDGII